MIIHMERSGGFAGIPLRATIDTHALEAEESRALQNLLEAAGFFNLPKTIQGQSGADRFQYRLTVEEETRVHSVEVSETAAPAELQEFIRRVSLLARQSRG